MEFFTMTGIQRFVLFLGIRLCAINFIRNVLLILPKHQSISVVKCVSKLEKFGAHSKCNVFNALNVNVIKLFNITISIVKDVRLTALK